METALGPIAPPPGFSLARFTTRALGLVGTIWSRRTTAAISPETADIGTTREEIVQVRAADRAAQGITAEQERAGEKAVAQGETVAQGRLTVLRLPHSRNAVATDYMDPVLGGPGFENLLVISPEEVSFYGEGTAIAALSARFPGNALRVLTKASCIGDDLGAKVVLGESLKPERDRLFHHTLPDATEPVRRIRLTALRTEKMQSSD